MKQFGCRQIVIVDSNRYRNLLAWDSHIVSSYNTLISPFMPSPRRLTNHNFMMMVKTGRWRSFMARFHHQALLDEQHNLTGQMEWDGRHVSREERRRLRICYPDRVNAV